MAFDPLDKIKEEIAEDQLNSSGEEAIGGTATSLDADDDAGEAITKVYDHEPNGNKTLGDEINDAENSLANVGENDEEDDEPEDDIEE